MSGRSTRDSSTPPSVLAAPGAGAGSLGEPSVSSPPSVPPSEARERRSYERFEVTWSVDCATDETFLYATIGNISEMGIFVRTIEPLMVGTQLTLRFAPPKSPEPFVLRGKVQWINALRPLHDNPNPGMGIQFIDLTSDDRERLVEAIRTIAYLRQNPEPRD
jgi:type IV pilus assembly protein PilZ